MASLRLRIITPERTAFEGEVASLTAMTTTGEITILPNHVPLVTLLTAGEMHATTKDGDLLLAVSAGLLEIKPGNEITILARDAEHAEELDLALIEEAKKRAETALEDARNQDSVAFENAAASLARELARYKVATKHQKGRKIHTN